MAAWPGTRRRWRHEGISMRIESLLVTGGITGEVSCEVINLTSAVVLATADGSPISGVWS